MLSHNFQYKFGNFLLDSQNGILLRNREFVPLTGRTFKVLELLVKNQGRVIFKNNFFEMVWKDRFVTEGILTVAINSICKAFYQGGGEFIEAFPGEGYRFWREVERIVVKAGSGQ